MAHLATALRSEIPAVVGFAVAVFLTSALNFVVRLLHITQIRRLIRYDQTKTIGEIDAEFAQLMNDFDMKFAALIGKTERVLYAYAVMVSHYEIVAGWLVLKAFFGWLEDLQNRKERRHRMSAYHVYLYGNALSLLLGFFCGLAGLFVKSLLNPLFAS